MMKSDQNIETPKISCRPVLGSAVGGLRFELVLNRPPENKTIEDLEIPFATLSTTGYFSTILLARIAMGIDTTIKYFALKIQRNDYPVRLGDISYSNKKILKLWEIERNNLFKFYGSSEEIVELFDFGDRGVDDQNIQTFYQSKPITFCKRKKLYFHPLCPICASYLIDCIDDTFLTENGLSAYTTSSVRYLYCAECAKKSKKNLFYTYSLTPEEFQGARATIRRRTELYRDWMPLIQNRSNYALDSEMNRFLNKTFPCFSCEYQDECYSERDNNPKMILAENRLTPVSYYECILLPLELLHLQYDDFCDLIGGASWHEFRQAQMSKGITYAQQLIIDQIQPFFTSPHQFIFQEDYRGIFAIEILRLKLVAFTQLCRGIAAIHKKCQQPHLDIKPASVMAKLVTGGRDLPSRWNFGIKILDLGATSPFDRCNGNHSIKKHIFYPPHNFQKIYTSPIIHNLPFGHEEKVDVRILSVKPQKETKDVIHARVEMDLLSREIKTDDFSDFDLICINLHAPAKGLENKQIWASKTKNSLRLLRVLGENIELTPVQFSTLERCVNETFFDSNVAFYRSFHVPCDIYSLGIMLIRSLLVNDEQDLWQIVETIQRIVSQIQEQGLNSPIEIEMQLLTLLKEKGDALSSYAIFYRKEDREQQKNAIKVELWNQILVFTFKFLTNIKGFSFCTNHGDYDPKDPGVTMDKILAELEALNSQVHAELFGSREENKDILAACDRLWQQLQADLMAT